MGEFCGKNYMKTQSESNLPPASKAKISRPRFVAIAIVITAAIFLIHHAASKSAAETVAVLPVVASAIVTREDLFKELTIQAEFRPYQEVELHAKVAGYLRQINVDFGDQVKAGQLIATLEVPELGDDLTRAMAEEQRAQADYNDAHLDFTRLSAVNKSQPDLVAQQDLDAAEAKDGIAAANLSGAKADVKKYQTMVDYTQITAPFSGVVTQRYADPGALIQAGTASNTQSQPIIRLSEIDRLRLDFPISVTYAEAIAVADPVEIRLEASGQTRTGTITRFTHKIAMDTRTMETEVEVPNPDLKLIPGMYTTVTLKLQRRPQTLAIPIEAVSGTGQPTVYLINGDQRIEERPVQLGIETPTKYEVLSGLHEGDRIMIGNRSQVSVGQKVSINLGKLVAVQ
jgi:RND family efflux transporter MFP subunit